MLDPFCNLKCYVNHHMTYIMKFAMPKNAGYLGIVHMVKIVNA